MQIIERKGGTFWIDPLWSDLVPRAFWSTLSGSTSEAQQKADECVSESGHDCGKLGCPDWADQSM